MINWMKNLIEEIKAAREYLKDIDRQLEEITKGVCVIMSKVGRPSKKVVCITDPQGDSFYHVFDSVNECSDYYGIKDKTVVSKVCKGELDKYRGFVFMYYDDFQNVFNELSCKSDSHDIEYIRYKNMNRFEFAITIKNVPCFRGERK